MRAFLIIFLCTSFLGIQVCHGASDDTRQINNLREAISDLMNTFGDRYPSGASYQHRLQHIENRLKQGDATSTHQLEMLRKEALLANPLLREIDGVMVVKRRVKDLKKDKVFTKLDNEIGFSAGPGRDIGMPSNHECNASLERSGYDNEICLLDLTSRDQPLKTLYRPDDGGYVGELDLHFNGKEVLFTKSDSVNWKLFEMTVDGENVRQAMPIPDDVDVMDGCYLPNGKIVFGSTASYQSVPCWHGRKRVSNLYLMDSKRCNIRQLCFDQDHDFHPVVLDNGQVLFLRWDYTGISHIYLRELMTMNPDGTKQRAIYGSNSWYPNSLFFARQIPGTNRLICILSGYHGPHRMGQLVIIDPRKGCKEETGIIQRITGRGEPIKPEVRDDLVGGDWPMFLHPYPLNDKYFLVSCWMNAKSSWGIYLADVFDNLLQVHSEDGYALLEPIPVRSRKLPPVIPDQVDLTKQDATVFISDVYKGPGLKEVPRGIVGGLRIVSYNFGYRGLAGSDKIGYGGPWEAMHIIGTVPVEQDGSAYFKVPANTPISLQVLDKEGKAIQLMRSWLTAMPGESVSCVGCHESPKEVPDNTIKIASKSPPQEVTPWFGPARGFDFEREVQPVLDKYCLSCHDGSESAPFDLRSESDRGQSEPKPIGYVSRLHPDMYQITKGKLTYSPAYDVLIHYIRRVGIEDDVSMLYPGEYCANTSELIQMLEQNHQQVQLDAESLSRLVTWIDLNGPCHGTWGDVFPIPDGAHERRMELRQLYGGPKNDPEKIFTTNARLAGDIVANVISQPEIIETKAKSDDQVDEIEPQVFE